MQNAPELLPKPLGRPTPSRYSFPMLLGSGYAIRMAAIAGLCPALFAHAQLTYIKDDRQCVAQNSFTVVQSKVPFAPFSVFTDAAQAKTSNETGFCESNAFQNSSPTGSFIQATGNASVQCEAKASSPLVYASTGSSTFKVTFRADVLTLFQFSGGLAGTSGKSTISVALDRGGSRLFTDASAGSFSGVARFGIGQIGTLSVSCAANGLARWSGTKSDSASAGFDLLATAVEVLCLCDLNFDGQVDDGDFSIFVMAYDQLDCADPAMPAGCPADFNFDGVVDDADFSTFVVMYNALLCP